MIMNIFKRWKKTAEPNVNIYKAQTKDKKTITIKTKINLDEDQKETIFKIIERGLTSETESNNIPIAIMMATGINAIMCLNISGDEVELEF